MLFWDSVAELLFVHQGEEVANSNESESLLSELTN